MRAVGAYSSITLYVRIKARFCLRHFFEASCVFPERPTAVYYICCAKQYEIKPDEQFYSTGGWRALVPARWTKARQETYRRHCRNHTKKHRVPRLHGRAWQVVNYREDLVEQLKGSPVAEEDARDAVIRGQEEHLRKSDRWIAAPRPILSLAILRCGYQRG